MANKIQANKEDIILSYQNKEWNNFYDDKILNWSNLFNKKLCYEEKSSFLNNFYDLDSKEIETNENENEEKQEKEENNNENVMRKILFENSLIFLFFINH